MRVLYFCCPLSLTSTRTPCWRPRQNGDTGLTSALSDGQLAKEHPDDVTSAHPRWTPRSVPVRSPGRAQPHSSRQITAFAASCPGMGPSVHSTLSPWPHTPERCPLPLGKGSSSCHTPDPAASLPTGHLKILGLPLHAPPVGLPFWKDPRGPRDMRTTPSCSTHFVTLRRLAAARTSLCTHPTGLLPAAPRSQATGKAPEGAWDAFLTIFWKAAPPVGFPRLEINCLNFDF